MTRKQLQQYRFKNELQWNTCLLAKADHTALRANGVFRPFPPHAGVPTRYASDGAQTLAVLRTGEVLWCDNAGMLHRYSSGDVVREEVPAPVSITHASRIVSRADSLWVKSVQSESLECYDQETLAHLITVDLQPGRIIDLTGGKNGTLAVLIDRSDHLQCVRLSDSGYEIERISLSGIPQAKAFIYLSRSQQFVVLAGELQPRLYWFAETGGQALFSIPMAALQPCFKAELLGSDLHGMVALAGSISEPSGMRYVAFVLDANGNLVDEVALPLQANGIAITSQNLLIADASGLLHYATAEIVPDRPADVQCTLITPLMQSLGLEGASPWLRVDASTILPDGTTLELSYAATNELEVRDRLKAIADDDRLPAGLRIQKLLSEPDIWSAKTVFHGNDQKDGGQQALRSAPLFDVRARYLWLCVTLTAVRGARLPALTELSVWYPGRSLIENLPTPYRQDAAEPGNFLRSLVGVLEATTQDLDTRIAALGRHIHPATAAGPWMDYIARWLGLPWNDALAEDQKRAILGGAAELAKQRGTRAGLATLLECLLPGIPRRFRITDTIADYGYALIGGGGCTGSALPAMLGGFSRWHAELDTNMVLGYTRLPCPTQGSSHVQWPSGKIRIEVAAGYQEKQAWEPWFLALISEMVPFTVSVELRWVSVQTLRTSHLDDTWVLDAPPSPHLDSDAITGLARLPEQRRTRLSDPGSAMGIRLR